MKNVPYYKASTDDKGRVYLNILKEEGTININKVKYVKLTVPKKAVDAIDLSKYNTDNTKVKLVKPEQRYQEIEGRVGLVVPIELFEKMLLSKTDRPHSLSSLLVLTTAIDSIKLLNKDKEFIAYLLPSLDF